MALIWTKPSFSAALQQCRNESNFKLFWEKAKLQRCTESEIFDSDSAPASAEYTPTPLRLKTF